MQKLQPLRVDRLPALASFHALTRRIGGGGQAESRNLQDFIALWRGPPSMRWLAALVSEGGRRAVPDPKPQASSRCSASG